MTNDEMRRSASGRDTDDAQQNIDLRALVRRLEAEADAQSGRLLDEILQLQGRVAELEASAKLTADAARAYRANPLDAYDHPESWRLLGELVDTALRGEEG